MTYSITLTAAELNLIGAALHRLPPEQIALIDSLRRQAEAQEEQARAIGEGEGRGCGVCRGGRPPRWQRSIALTAPRYRTVVNDVCDACDRPNRVGRVRVEFDRQGRD